MGEIPDDNDENTDFTKKLPTFVLHAYECKTVNSQRVGYGGLLEWYIIVQIKSVI